MMRSHERLDWRCGQEVHIEEYALLHCPWVSESFPANAAHTRGALGGLPEDISLLRWTSVCCWSCCCQYGASVDIVFHTTLQQFEDIVPHLVKQDRSPTFRAAVARMKASSGAGSSPSQTGPTANKVGARMRRSCEDRHCAGRACHICHLCAVGQWISPECSARTRRPCGDKHCAG